MAFSKYLIAIVVTFAVLFTVNAQTGDVAAGLDCINDKNGKPIACKGENTVLQDSQTKIKTYMKNNNDEVQTKINTLQTRFGGPQSGSGISPGTPQYCKSSSCQTTVQQIYTPSLLYNTHGDARFVLQLPSFNQFVYLAVCENENAACDRFSTCEQKRFPYNLLVWDPFYPDGGLYVEEFTVPSGCCCKTGHAY